MMRIEAPRCMEFAQMVKMSKFAKFDEKNMYFLKLFYTRLMGYLPKEAYCPPEIRKHTLNHPRLADIPKRPRPF